MRKITLLFLIVHSFGYSQTLLKELDLVGSLNRMDYFVGGNIRFFKKRWEFGAEAAVGVNRTIAQQRFFPRVGLTAGYKLIQSDAFRIIPEIKTAFSLLNLRTTSPSVHVWQEVYGGFVFSAGNKMRFKIATYFGWINENFTDDFTGSKVNYGTLGYEGLIGIGYAW